MILALDGVRRRDSKEAVRMREPIVFADVTLHGFMAEPDNRLDFVAGDARQDRFSCVGSMPR
jgi:hypothetical protein